MDNVISLCNYRASLKRFPSFKNCNLIVDNLRHVNGSTKNDVTTLFSVIRGDEADTPDKHWYFFAATTANKTENTIETLVIVSKVRYRKSDSVAVFMDDATKNFDQTYVYKDTFDLEEIETRTTFGTKLLDCLYSVHNAISKDSYEMLVGDAFKFYKKLKD